MVNESACQGVIALNMKDGILHRFQVVSTILATGVMAEHISLQPQSMHALEMVMSWLHVLGSLSRISNLCSFAQPEYMALDALLLRDPVVRLVS